MQLPLQNFTSLMQAMAAALQGASTQLLDLTVGSVLRAVLEANASIALWIQWLIVQVLGVTRAATSTGSDLDSWMADFSFTRLPATSAAGAVTFSRYTPSLAAFIPVGAQVRSSDGSQVFSVTADPSNPAFNAALDGFSIGASVASVTVPVAANSAGTGGNVQAGTVTTLAIPIAGVDSVSNAFPFSGGANAEPDAAFRARFANYIQSRTLATDLAVATAIESLQQGLAYVLTENVDAAGNPLPGSFLVTLDDGSGDPPASLLAAATAAIGSVRPIGSAFAVQPPSAVLANIAMSVSLSPGANPIAVTSGVTAALAAAINALPIGATLPWSRLAQIAYDASAQVVNVQNVLLNGGVSDMVVPPYGIIKAGQITVS